MGAGEEVCSARNEVRSLQCEKRGTEFAVRETRYGVCSARNEVRSLQCEKRGTEFAVRETRYGVCSARNERQSLSERELRIKNCVELELRFKNCVERVPGFPSIILSPFVFHIRCASGSCAGLLKE